MFKSLLITLGLLISASAFSREVVLTESNVVTLADKVDAASVTKVMIAVQKLNALKTDEPIFLVLNTPGGSIFDGFDLIRYLKSSRRKVNTVTIFAASMGFQIVQSLNERLITEGGVLMSHRASVGGIGGQLPGELNSRVDFVMQVSKELDANAAKRASITLEQYTSLIHDEYYATPIKAVAEKFADEKVDVSCDASLNGTTTIEIESFFGTIEAEIAKCPLITSVISAKFKKADEKNKDKDALELTRVYIRSLNVTR